MVATSELPDVERFLKLTNGVPQKLEPMAVGFAKFDTKLAIII